MSIPKQKTNWAKSWREGKTGFHLSHPNPNLEKYAHILADCKKILFPLCGKTLDMHYMHHKGHHCIGVERVEKAIQSFFAEWDVIPKQNNHIYQHQQITIHHQNIFAVHAENIPNIDGIFDRAALIALPIEIRQQYANHLLSFLPAGGKILMITIDMPRPQEQGPPFLVRKEAIPTLFSAASDVSCLAVVHKTPKDEPFLLRNDMEWMDEYVWSITK